MEKIFCIIFGVASTSQPTTENETQARGARGEGGMSETWFIRLVIYSFHFLPPRLLCLCSFFFALARVEQLSKWIRWISEKRDRQRGGDAMKKRREEV